jgi:FHA domain
MMTVRCPRGHESATTDYCDECGARIELGGHDTVEPDPSSMTQLKPPKPPPGEPCPRCQTLRIPGDRYCEVDGYDFEDSAIERAEWLAIVDSDRAFFDRNAVEDLVFPSETTTRTFALRDDTVTIGRRSPRRDIFPTIDLGEPPEDPGVSREHARLERAHDGRYALVDCGSANGTFLNTDRIPIPVDVPIPLADGDTVHVGAWTTITIRNA